MMISKFPLKRTALCVLALPALLAKLCAQHQHHRHII